MTVPALIYLILHLAAFTFFRTYLWGTDSWGSLTLYLGVVLFLVGAGSVSPGVIDKTKKYTDTLQRWLNKVPFVDVLIISVFVLAIAGRQYFFSGGGSLLNISPEKGLILSPVHAGDDIFHYLIFKLTGAYINPSSAQIYKFSAVLAGVIAIAGIGYYTKKITHRKHERWITGLLIFFSGSFLLFFGNSGSYSLAGAFQVLFYFSVLSMLSKKRFNLFPAVFLSLAIMMHLASLMLLPALIYSYYALETNNSNRKQVQNIFASLSLFLLLIFIFFGTVFYPAFLPGITIEQPVGARLLAYLESGINLGNIFSLCHWNGVINLLLLVFPAIIALPLIYKYLKKRNSDPVIRFLIFSIIPLLLLMIFYNSEQIIPSDWAKFYYTGFPLTIAAAWVILKTDGINISHISVPLILISAIHTVPMVYSNLQPDEVIKRAGLAAESSCAGEERKSEYLKMLRESYPTGTVSGELAKTGEQDDYDPGYLFSMAKNYLENGDTAKALDALSITLASDEMHERSLQMAGMIYYHRDSLDKAESAFREILYRSPQNENALLMAGKIYLKKDEPDVAADYFKRVIRVNPNNPENLNALADIYIKDGSTDDALAVLNRWYLFDKDNAEVNYKLALVYKKLNNPATAKQYLEKAERSGYDSLLIKKLKIDISQ